jgi:predicted CXXCH cytochrome family protein
MKTRNALLPHVLALLVLGILMIVTGVMMVFAQETTPAVEPESTPPVETSGEDADQPSNAYCLLCHSQPDRTWTLPSGEVLSLTIDPAILAQSVHGESNPEGPLACADCHTNHTFPHPPQLSQSIREFQLERYVTCRNCHEEQYTHQQDSVHNLALEQGRLEAATCVDCHGAHDIQPPDEPRQRISLTCGRCHGAIFDLYRQSVHGTALLAEGNPDVPTCIDCHGVHNIADPTTTLFRVRSPQLCANCHANDELMAKYDISTHVFESYLTDFHGTTVALFEQQDPNVPTNKAVCADCHGVHDIKQADEENSSVIRANLLATCQQCHPNASSDFPDSWVGHFPPTLESHPLLFLVRLFYNILIPVTIAAFIFLVATDIFRRIRGRLSGRRSAER